MSQRAGRGSSRAPLADVLVLDLTQFLAGPNCTQILADLGARVIKVEPPAGDPTRDIPPHFVNDLSAYFISVNHGKESVILDLKTGEGRSAFLRLATAADVVVENFRPGVVDRLGVGYADIAGVNKAVVYCSIAGFGSTGPYHSRPAYDIIVQALSGAMGVTGEHSGGPVRLGIPIGDLGAGMYAAIGVLAALRARELTGEGTWIEVSMLDSLVSMLSYLGQYYLTAGEVAGPQGSGHVSIPTYRAFLCADDGWIVVAANTERMWEGLCGALELSSLVSDRRFLTNEQRLENRQALDAFLEPAFLVRASGEWLERLHAAGVPAAPVNTIDRALTDPQVVHNHMVVSLDDGEGAEHRILGTPLKIGDSEPEYAWPPRLGEHTRAVLESVAGLSSEEVDVLLSTQPVGRRPPTRVVS